MGSSSSSAASVVERRRQVVIDVNRTNRPHVRCDRDPEATEQRARARADSHARGGFPCARAFEHVAEVVVAVLERTGEIGMPGARPGDRGRWAPAASGAGDPPTVIVHCQLTQSLFRTRSATGDPSVSPLRTPERISTRSDSMAMRRPRP